ncbi:MAG: hypothetical protein U1E10_14365 [Bdellovibrionales bacterium]|nr:hypothetical protein [Bdellovibrionales bacterium]
MRNELYISRGQSEEFENGLEIALGEVNSIEYVRAPGGKVTGLKLPATFSIPLTLRGERGRLRTELKVTADTPHPSVQWNTHHVTFVSIEHESAGYKIKFRLESVKLPEIKFGVGRTNFLASGQSIGDPDKLAIHHAGYVSAHRTSGNGKFSTQASCIIEVSDKVDSKTIHLDSPLRTASIVEWKTWVFTFKNTDPNGGTMGKDVPVEFEVKAK